MSKPSGRPPLARITGNLLPVYEVLKRLMPHLPASRSQKGLAAALGQQLGNPALSVPNMLRELGHSGDKANTIHPDYLHAFRAVFSLDQLGISNDILLLEDGPQRERAIRALLEHQCFEWLWAQRSDQAQLCFAMANNTLGPNSAQFQRLPLAVPDEVPVGTKFRFAITLPWPAHIIMLSQDPTPLHLPLPGFSGHTILHRPTFCLDRFVGVAGQRWPAQTTTLPGELAMDPPLGQTRTVFIATPKPCSLPWQSTTTVELSLEQLAGLMRGLIGQTFLVAGLAYHVKQRDL